MNPWIPEKDPKVLRRVGKTGEEASELAKVCFRITIQGLDGVDPASGDTNRVCLEKEIADVMAQCDLTMAEFDLDLDAVMKRIVQKKQYMAEWERLVAPLEA